MPLPTSKGQMSRYSPAAQLPIAIKELWVHENCSKRSQPSAKVFTPREDERLKMRTDKEWGDEKAVGREE
jgi:hypothetical protein